MKSLNNYLLTRYPLIWNLRVHWVWPAIIVLHLLFFSAGYLAVSFPGSVTPEALWVPGVVAGIALLCGVLIGVLWMIHYFRNNALQAFYPLKRGRLMAEFALILATVFGASTFAASYQGGVYGHVRSLTRDTDLRQEADVVNLAHHFIAFNREEFSSSGDCRYQKLDYEAGVVRATSADPRVDTFSYLHYCNEPVSFSGYVGERSKWANDTIAKSWLYAGRQDSVRQLLADFVAICKKYRVNHKFDPAKMAEAPFERPGFLVTAEVSRTPFTEPVYNDTGGMIVPARPAEVFVDDRRLSEALVATDEARDGWMDPELWLLFLYCTLGISLLIFSFRITRLRIWFTALIGAGIWLVIFGVIGAGLRDEDRLVLIYLVLTLAFFATAIYLVARRESKRVAGVSLVWALWCLPAFLPVLAGWIQRQFRRDYYYENEAAMSVPIEAHPAYAWIRDHWPLINGLNALLVIVILAFVLIPLARRWQAMPEA